LLTCPVLGIKIQILYTAFSMQYIKYFRKQHLFSASNSNLTIFFVKKTFFYHKKKYSDLTEGVGHSFGKVADLEGIV